jgi:glyoxalase family protein
VRVEAADERFGDRALPCVDTHGLALSLVEPGRQTARPFTPWDDSPIPAAHQIRGLYGAEVWQRDAAATTAFLTGVLGFVPLATAEGVARFGFPDAAGVLDVRQVSGVPRGAWGVGCVHHLAWRVDDEAHQHAVRAQVLDAGGRPTEVIDRFWFKSVYFKEPGGVLFELATDGPGFTADEAPDHLGETLVLPPWLERQRAEIERVLPVLADPRIV